MTLRTSLAVLCLCWPITHTVSAQTELTRRPVVLVAYHSVGGHTQQMAEAVARGAASVPMVEVRLRTVSDADSQDVRSAAAIIVGSPVYNAAAAPEVLSFINQWPFDGSMKDKIGGAFTTGGGISAGEELVQVSILQSMLVFGMIVVGGQEWTSAFGASAVTEEQPFSRNTIDPRFLKKAEILGRRVSELVLRLR